MVPDGEPVYRVLVSLPLPVHMTGGSSWLFQYLCRDRPLSSSDQLAGLSCDRTTTIPGPKRLSMAA
jgi:hypothetical protein